MFDDLIEDTIALYPEGLSRGIDNDKKYEMYYKIVEEMKGQHVKLWYAIKDDVRPDHYTTFMAGNKIYIYSQPYRAIESVDEITDKKWDIDYVSSTSWYYPDMCCTIVYSRPVSEFFLYQSKVDNAIWVFPDKLDTSDMRYKKLKEYIS